jgi:preprotein translocase subunit SecA
MSVGSLVGGLAGTAAGQAAAAAPGVTGSQPAGAAVADDATGAAEGGDLKVSGVDLAAPGQRGSALRYSAPGEDGRAVETGTKPVERKADRRGKKVKRRRR